MVIGNIGQQSQVLSGRPISPSVTSIQNPWSGRLQGNLSPATLSNVSCKGKEKFHDSRLLEPSTIFDVDGELSDSNDAESSILAILELQVQRKINWHKEGS